MTWQNLEVPAEGFGNLPNKVDKHRDDAITMAVLLSDLNGKAETKSLCAKAVPIEREVEIVRYSSNRLRTIGQCLINPAKVSAGSR